MMNMTLTRTVIELLFILAMVGLLLELVNTHAWAVLVIAAAIIGWIQFRRAT